MITLNRIGDAITGTVNGKSFGVSWSQERWDAMQEVKARANVADSMDTLKLILEEFEPLTHESYKEVVESKSPYLYVNAHTNRFYLKYNQVISKEPLPQAFVDRVLESVEKNIDPKPLVKCWARFLRNPNYTEAKATSFAWYINQVYTNPNQVQKLLQEGLTHERASQIATSYQTPITEEGLICTYKVSNEITKKFVKDADTEDGTKQVLRDGHDYTVDEFSGLKTYTTPEHVEDRVFEPAVMHQGGDEFIRTLTDGTFIGKGHIIKVGEVHSLEKWEQVNCNDRQSGVKGLHCGNLDYIRCYQSDGTVTHQVLVDPMDIGAVVQDGTGAIRVKAYMVYASFAGVNRSLYHSATYGKLKDDEYADMVMAVVNKTREEAISAAQTAYEQKVDLVG